MEAEPLVTLTRDAFQAAWQSGNRPDITEFLKDLEEPDRTVTLRELIRLEIEHRRRAGEVCRESDYSNRFPESRELIDSLFSETPSLVGPSPPGTQQRPADLSSHADGASEATLALSQAADGHGQQPSASTPDSTPALVNRIVPVGEFQRALLDSGLMDQDELNAFLDSLPADYHPEDGRQLAQELCVRGKLTQFQVEAVCEGETRFLVAGNYVVLDVLGAGGMGQVYKARHKRMDRLVALKVLPDAATGSPHSVERFQREVKAAARLTHPNIVTAYDADEHRGVHFLVMEYVQGRDLTSLVRESGPLPIKQAVDCIVQAARGLEYAHSQGIIHRDIKPQNLLLDKSGTVRILDMGLALLEERVAGSHDDDGAPRGDAVVGTLNYMSPEQAMDPNSADARADIYSLGCTLHFLLTGKPPYRGETTAAKVEAHRAGPIPSLRAARADVPAMLDLVFARMLAKSAGERQTSMRELLRDLELIQLAIDAGNDAGVAIPPPASGELSELTRSNTGKPIARSAGREDLPHRPSAPEANSAYEPRHSRPTRMKASRLAGMVIAATLISALTIVATIVAMLRPNASNRAQARNQSAPASHQAKGQGTASRPGPTPSPLNAAPVNAAGSNDDRDRVVGALVTGIGGTLTVRSHGAEREVTSADQFPTSPFQVIRINLMGKQSVSDDDARRIATLESVRELYMGGTQLTDAGLEAIALMPALTHLNIDSTGVTEAGIRRLAQRPGLRLVDLNHLPVTDASLPMIARLQHLEVLALCKTQISPEGLKLLWPLHQLYHLALSGSNLTDRDLSLLRKFDNLHSIELTDMRKVTAGGLAKLFESFPMDKVWLSGSPVDEGTMEAIGANPFLSELTLDRTNVTDNYIGRLYNLLNPLAISLLETKVSANTVRRLGERYPGCNLIVDPASASSVPPRGRRTFLTTTDVSDVTAYDGLAPDKWISLLPSRQRLVGWQMQSAEMRNAEGTWVFSSSPPGARGRMWSGLGWNSIFGLRRIPRDVAWRLRARGGAWKQISVATRGENLDGERRNACSITLTPKGDLTLLDECVDGNLALGRAHLPSSFKPQAFEIALAAVGRRIAAFVNGVKILTADDSSLLRGGGIEFQCVGSVTLEAIDCQILDYATTPTIQQILDAPDDIQRETADWILRLGGTLAVARKDGESAVPDAKSLPASPFSIVRVSMPGAGDLLSDLAISRISWLPDLQSLDVSGSPISDAGLEHLKAAKNLLELNVAGTKVTPSGVAQLSAALPACRIKADAQVQGAVESMPKSNRSKTAPSAEDASGSGSAAKVSAGEPPLAVAPFDAGSAREQQLAWAAYLHWPVELTDSIGMEFKLVPPGQFLMGSANGEAERDATESQHPVRITKPFYLGVYEVTQAEYERVTGNNPSRFAPTRRGNQPTEDLDPLRFPVDFVSEPYPVGAATDPQGPATGTLKVFRGGGWGNYAAHCRAANRYWGAPSSRWDSLGFRVVLVPPER